MPSSKAPRQKGGGSSKKAASAKGKKEKKKKKQRSPDTQDAGQPSGGSVASRGSSASSKQNTCCPCCRRRSPNDSPCTKLLVFLGLQKRKKTDDMVRFDDEVTSLESALLWSKDGTEPTADDYLEFSSEHERGIEESVTKVSLPKPEEDKTDY